MVAQISKALQSAGHTLIDVLRSTWLDSAVPVAAVQAELSRANYAGVVLLGGYDVIPSHRIDCLPPRLRAIIGHDSGDTDDFIVWSDDPYGDVNGDLTPDLPVSRIPDGNDAQLVLQCLGAAGANGSGTRAGVRNIMRPFADQVFAGISGTGQMLISKPTVFHSMAQDFFGAQQIYLMLHGSYQDGTRFWGENTPGNTEAVGLANIPPATGMAVFTGCCWGGLIVDTLAKDATMVSTPGNRTAKNSIALRFLMNGANAFVGCTGEHYSPADEPQLYFGGPMHLEFWNAYSAGTPPAQALWEAKKKYFAAMPHGQTDPEPEGIEFKILRQYTCLGLGW